MAPTMAAFEAHLYECHACGKDCNSKGGLTTRLKHCRKIVFTCAECNEVFHSKAALDGHRKKHTKGPTAAAEVHQEPKDSEQGNPELGIELAIKTANSTDLSKGHVAETIEEHGNVFKQLWGIVERDLQAANIGRGATNTVKPKRDY